MLSSDQSEVFKEGDAPQLKGNLFRLVLNVADLPSGQYAVEFLLKNAAGQTLTCIQRPVEVIADGPN